jgi:hypothetical protein
MSINNEIVQTIIKGIRQSIKTVIIPELSNPFSMREAISIYVILKTIEGYISPEFSENIKLNNEECVEVLKQVAEIYEDSEGSNTKKWEVKGAVVRGRIDAALSIATPQMRSAKLNDALCYILEDIANEKHADKKKETVRKVIRRVLKNQLDRELALLT